MPRASRYVATETDSSRCPRCGRLVVLLMHQTGRVQRHPAFYVCHACGFIGQVGVGPVTRQYRGDLGTAAKVADGVSGGDR